MPNKRSYFAAEGPLSYKQWKRRERDLYYCTAHSGPGLKFIGVPLDMANEAKSMVRGRMLHRHRDSQNGFASHYGRCASRAALLAGSIDVTAHAHDCKLLRLANIAKHGRRDVKKFSCPSAQANAEEDPMVLNDPWHKPLPPSSGASHDRGAVELPVRISSETKAGPSPKPYARPSMLPQHRVKITA